MYRQNHFIFERQTGGFFLPRDRSAPGPEAKIPANLPLELLALEDRVLYSAAPIELPGTDAAGNGDILSPEQQLDQLISWVERLNDGSAASPFSTDDSDQTSTAEPNGVGPTSILLVVDQGIADYEDLLRDLQSQLPEGYGLLLIDSANDGWNQLTDYLASHFGIQEIHLFSHAQAGQLQLGNRAVEFDDLLSEESGAIWKRALEPTADVLLYGCNLASGATGASFVSQFAMFSGADVAASIDRTGTLPSADWDLEFTVGLLSHDSLFSNPPPLAWEGSLDILELPLTGVQETSGLDRGNPGAVALNSDGSYVIVWSEEVAGMGWEVRASRFDASGAQLGSVFTVNQQFAWDQRYASVDMDSSGRFVVTWTGIDSSNQGIYARLFAADGSALTNEFVVNSYQPSAQSNSSVSMAEDGRFVIAWEGNGSEDAEGIYARRFEANGVANGGQIFVNASSAGSQENPTVSMNSAGDFVVAWNDQTSYRYQLFDSSGNKLNSNGLTAPEITVSNLGTARRGDILLNHDGTIVSTWQEMDSGHWNIFFRKDANGGSPLLGKSLVQGNPDNDYRAPSIDGSGSGEFIITWEGSGDGDADGGVYYRLYNSSGLATPYTLLANGNYTTGYQGRASAASRGLEDYVVVWSGQSAFDSADIGHSHVQNPLPFATNDLATAVEAGGYSNQLPGSLSPVNVLTNDVDPGDTLVVVGVISGTGSFSTSNLATPLNGLYGTLTLQANGDLSYTLDESNPTVQALRTSMDSLSETFTYTVRDSGYMVATASLTIVINGQNDAPTAIADTASASESGGVNNGIAGFNPGGNVLTNDFDHDSGDTQTVTGVDSGVRVTTSGNLDSAVSGTYGSLILAANGLYSYTVDNLNPNVQALRTSSQTLTDTFSYTITDAAGLTSTAQITFTIQGANDTPLLAILSPVTIGENPPNATALTSAEATDVDSGETLTYSLSNNAGGRFAINASTGLITVANSTLLNYENATSHTITIRVTDLAGTINEKSLTVNLTDLNEFPVSVISDANTSQNSLPENSATGALTGITAQATDDDGSATIAYSLDDDAGGRFAINSSTGVITVANGSLLNLEAATSHAVTVRASSSDGGFSIKAFTINLTDVNEFSVTTPLDTNASPNQVPENAANGTAVGITASAFDQDGTTNLITYSLDDSAGGRFAINAATGIVTVANSSLLNYEAATSHTIIVRATSADASATTRSFTVNLTDFDEFDVSPVVDLNPAGDRVAEQASVGTVVGITAGASDADATTNSIIWTLDENAGGRFAIDAATGVITVADGNSLDFETATSHSITVRATSADGSFQVRTFLIEIDNRNETPLASADQATATEAGGLENQTSGVDPVGNVLANDSDPDHIDSLVVLRVESTLPGSSSFAAGQSVAGEFGSIVIQADGTYHYTVNNDHPQVEALRSIADQLTDTFRYTIRDPGGLESTTELTVIIQGANDTPHSIWSETGLLLNTSPSNNQYIEFEDVGNLFARPEFTLRLSFTTSQQRPVFFSYATPADDNELRISEQNGELSVYLRGHRWDSGIDISQLNDGERHELALVRTVADGGLKLLIDGTLAASKTGFKSGVQLQSEGTLVLGQEQDGVGGGFNPAQIFRGIYWDLSLHSTAWSAAKVNLNVGQTFHDLPDLRGHWDFSLTGGSQVLDQIGTRHGALRSIPAGEAWVGGTHEQIQSDWIARVVENAAQGTVVANLAAADFDTGEQLTWTLLDDANGRFAVDSSTGTLTVLDSGLLNYELQQNLQIRVEVTDAEGLSREETLQIQLTDVEETGLTLPVDLDSGANQVAENSAAGTLVQLQVWAVDENDPDNQVTYSLDDDAEGRFVIDSQTGTVTVNSGARLDREEAATHQITVRATSESGATASRSFSIEVADVNEFAIGPISDLDPADNLLPEDATAGSAVGITIFASDADATANQIRYSLDDDARGRFSIDEQTGVVTLAVNGLLDYESAQSHTIIVRATSEDGSFRTEVLAINLDDVIEQDPHEIIDLDSTGNLVFENSAVRTYTGLTVSAADVNGVEQPITWSLLDSDGGRFAIDPVTGRIYTDLQLDFETEGPSRQVRVSASYGDGNSRTADFEITIADVFRESFNTFSGIELSLSSGEIFASDREQDFEVTQFKLNNLPEFGELYVIGVGGSRILSPQDLASLSISSEEGMIYSAPADTQGEFTLGYTAETADGRQRTGLVKIAVSAAGPLPPPRDSSSPRDADDTADSAADQDEAAAAEDRAGEPATGKRDSLKDQTGSPAGKDPFGGTGDFSALGAYSLRTSGVQQEQLAARGIGADIAPSQLSVDVGPAHGETLDAARLKLLDQLASNENGANPEFSNSILISRIFTSAAAIEEKLANSIHFAEYLSRLAETVEKNPVLVGFTMPVYASAGAGLLTVGYVAWLVRGGVLLTSFISSLPSWQSFDPLPVLENAGEGEDETSDQGDTSIAELVDSEQPLPAMSGAIG